MSTSDSRSREKRPARKVAAAGGAGKPVADASSAELAREAAQHALAKKAEDLVVLDLRTLSPIADFFVIATGLSDVHVRAIADSVQEGLLAGSRRAKPWHLEGNDTLRWVLLDYVTVVVHVFQRGTREYYGLERFWGDAPREEIADAPGGAGGAA
ncbi:ribosome silencing factor [bacterium]|nr:ribosome silencing factor [bacterium]